MDNKNEEKVQNLSQKEKIRAAQDAYENRDYEKARRIHQ